MEGAWKNYGHWWKSTTVLHDINLHVPKGIMYVLFYFQNLKNKKNVICRYGLLGPSGCGKTTLLRCIVGRLELNRGEVFVFGKRPGTRGHDIPGRAVGFMPQETALYKNFSISEMLHHFGRLHNMNRKDILSREQFLLSFLDLPPRTRNVSQLRFHFSIDLFIYFNLKKKFFFSKVVVNNVVYH
jgi:ABC-type multidrug transport system ATPase subunit